MLSYIAAGQLAAWEKLASGWHLATDYDEGVIRCGGCGKGVMLLSDRNGTIFQYTPDEHRALVVLHLRNFHPGLDPDRPTQAL